MYLEGVGGGGGGVGGGGNVPTRPNCNCKLFTCQLVLVAAAPVLQYFHPGEKVCVCVCVCGGGGGMASLPPGSYGPDTALPQENFDYYE